MEKLTQFFLRRLTSWHKGLEKGLEIVLESTPSSLPDHQLPVSQFEVLTDLSHLKDTLEFLPNNSTDRLIHIFSRLAPYFDSGVLLYKHSDSEDLSQEYWSPGAVFCKGEYYPLEAKHLQLRLLLPRLNYLELRKTSPFTILQQMQLNEINDSPDSSAFAIKADPDYLFLLFTELPQPWLRTHVENIFAILIEGLERN